MIEIYLGHGRMWATRQWDCLTSLESSQGLWEGGRGGFGGDGDGGHGGDDAMVAVMQWWR